MSRWFRYRWLVTASHCLGGHASQYSVVLGAHDIRTQRQGQPRRYYISRYIMHPRFEYSSSKFFPNDIALLYTSSNVDTYSKYAAAVPMASQNEKFVGNSNCYITGWGRTSSGSPNILQVGGHLYRVMTHWPLCDLFKILNT